jgi:hypothetical protein
MERESDKHSARIDDAMARDVESLLKGAPEESRAQEARLQEDPGVGPGRRFDVEEHGGPGIPEAEADERSELARHLAAATFPAARDDLVVAARSANAPDHIVGALRALPEDEPYANVQGVWLALGGRAERPHTH